MQSKVSHTTVRATIAAVTTVVVLLAYALAQPALAAAREAGLGRVNSALEHAIAWHQAGFPGEKSGRFPGSDDIAAHYALAFLTLSEVRPSSSLRRTGLSYAEDLLSHPDTDGDGTWGWGLHGAYGGNPPELPRAYTTVSVGLAFLKAWEVSRDRRWFDAALRVAEDLAYCWGHTEVPPDLLFFWYTPIRNADRTPTDGSSLVAGYIMHLGRLADRDDLVQLGRKGADLVVHYQLPSGQWAGTYPEADPKNALKNDPCHLGLTALGVALAHAATGEDAYRGALEKAAEFLTGYGWLEGELNLERGPPLWMPGSVLITLGIAEDLFGRSFGTDRIAEEVAAHERGGVFFGDCTKRGHSWVLWGLADYISRKQAPPAKKRPHDSDTPTPSLSSNG